MSNSAENYLRDAFVELLDRAREARSDSKKAGKDGEDVAFQQGRALAYYEVLSYLLGQLEGFQIDRSAVGVDPALDLDRELL